MERCIEYLGNRRRVTYILVKFSFHTLVAPSDTYMYKNTQRDNNGKRLGALVCVRQQKVYPNDTQQTISK